MAALSMQDGMEMFKSGDEAHLKAMSAMRELMHEDGAMEKWMEERRAEFNAL